VQAVVFDAGETLLDESRSWSEWACWLGVSDLTLARGIRVGSIVIRRTRFDEMRVFWQAALGYVPREAPQDGWVVLTDPSRRDSLRARDTG
jgi:hypothetical protein